MWMQEAQRKVWGRRNPTQVGHYHIYHIDTQENRGGDGREIISVLPVPLE